MWKGELALTRERVLGEPRERTFRDAEARANESDWERSLVAAFLEIPVLSEPGRVG